MGFNSVVLICNDVVHTISKDPVSWWKSAWEALSTLNYSKEKSGTKGRFRNCQAVWNSHADNIGIIAVGRNHATVLHTSYGCGHSSDEDKLHLLKEWANAEGYYLRKKRKPIDLRQPVDGAEYYE